MKEKIKLVFAKMYNLYGRTLWQWHQLSENSHMTYTRGS